jgi:hypothetical protein
MTAVASILFAVTLTGLVSLALGRLFLRALAVKLYRQEEIGIAFVVGSAWLSLFVFVSMAAHVAYKPVFLAFAALVFVFAWRRRIFVGASESMSPMPRFAWVVFGIAFAAYTWLYLAHAMAPETSPDGSTYHLGLVARYLRERGFPRITSSMYANLSQGVEMLFAYAFAFGRHSSAAMVHFLFTLTLPFLMIGYGRRIARPWVGVFGAALVNASPLVGKDGTSAYIDLAVAAIVFSIFYLLEIWDAERQPGLLWVVGLLCGFAFAAKYTAGVAIPYAIGYVAWRSRSWRPVVPVAAMSIVLAAPWLIKNLVVLGNPVSPFFNRVFPNPYIHVKFEDEYRQLMRDYEVNDKREIPLEVTVRGRKLTGFIGAVFLLSPIALLALRRREGRHLLLAAAVFGSAYATNIGARFLLFALPFVSLAMGLAFERWKWLLIMIAVAHAYTSWPSVVRKYCDPGGWRLAGVPWKAALRIQSEEDYLNNVSTYRVAKWLDAMVPEGKRVLSPNGVASAYTRRDVWIGYESALNETMMDMLYSGFTSNYQPRRAWDFYFERAEVEKVRLLQTGTGQFPELWSVNEVRFFEGERELARSPEWRLTSKPNPWEIQLAFDGNIATRWRSWDTVSPGQFIEVSFGKKRALTRVRVEMSPDLVSPDVRIEGWKSGHWEELINGHAQSEITPPHWIRLALMKEVKARGVDYLLIADSDYGSDDFREDPEAWGLELVSAKDAMRLYRITAAAWE